MQNTVQSIRKISKNSMSSNKEDVEVTFPLLQEMFVSLFIFLHELCFSCYSDFLKFT